MSHELIAYWNRRLTRTPPLFARSPLGLDQLWLFELCFAFQDRGRREQNLKNHKRHELAMTFVQRFLRNVRLSDDAWRAVRKAMQSNRLNLRG